MNTHHSTNTTDRFGLSIIIVSWNVHDLLAQCLTSLLIELESLPNIQGDIIVVDNASSDGTVEMVRKRFPSVHLIVNQENIGFARANNQALGRFEGDYAMLLNPDTIIKPGAISNLIEFMDQHRDAGAAGPRLLNSDGTLQESCFREPTLFREFLLLFHIDSFYSFDLYQYEKWDIQNPRPVEGLKGACILLRGDVIKEVGIFDQNYFMYSEEVDYCYRIHQAGWQLFWVPSSEVVHLGGESTRQIAKEMFQQLYIGKVRFFRTHRGRLTASMYKLILLLAALVRLVLTPIVYLESPSRRRTHLTLAGNYIKLLATLPSY